VLECLSRNEAEIYTHCIEFFDFSILEQYDCNAFLYLICDNKQIVLDLKRLLNNEYDFLDRELRIGHNIPKMVLAGVFNSIAGNIVCTEVEDVLDSRILNPGDKIYILDLISVQQYKYLCVNPLKPDYHLLIDMDDVPKQLHYKELNSILNLNYTTYTEAVAGLANSLESRAKSLRAIHNINIT